MITINDFFGTEIAQPETSARESRDSPQFSTLRVLPDPAICRARSIGLANYADCLVENPYECPHALSFGFGFFCQHPQRSEIVMRTATHGH